VDPVQYENCLLTAAWHYRWLRQHHHKEHSCAIGIIDATPLLHPLSGGLQELVAVKTRFCTGLQGRCWAGL